MPPTVDWHERYLQQAGWTSQTRNYLYEKSSLRSARNILDVGCGTGALLIDLPALTQARIFGLDLSLDASQQAQDHAPSAKIVCGDGHQLPYPDGFFDITFCHFLLLWVASPVDVLKEMKRVTRPGGCVLALAEPDYSGRIDYPSLLEPLGHWQAESLCKQGADPDSGRKLKGWFSSAGIAPIESGIIPGGWPGSPLPGQRELEWAVLESDLAGFIPSDEIMKLKSLDQAAWTRGERVLFVPTFYAWGRV